MATVNTLPIRQIAESGDHAVGKDGSAGEEALFPLGTAASYNVGPALGEAPRGSDLHGSLEGGAAGRFDAVSRYISTATNSDHYLAVCDLSKSGTISGEFRYNGGVNRRVSKVWFQVHNAAGQGYNSIFHAGIFASPALEMVEFDAGGKRWLGFRASSGGRSLFDMGLGIPQLCGPTWNGETTPDDIQGFETTEVSNITPASNATPVSWSGFPGAAIGNFSPLRNTAIADMSVATDFQVLEKQTWTPRLEGTSVAGSPTYVRQVGFFWRYGKEYYGTYEVEISAKDAAASGALLVRGMPTIADTSIAEHMATISRFHNITAPVDVIQYAPYYVPQGGLHAIRFSVLKNNAAGGFLDASALTNTSLICGSFKFTVV